MPEPPSERQLAYARDLGISIPPNATKEDLSDLISAKVDRDKPATERHRSFAAIFGVQAGDHIGKKTLFERIWYTLAAEGREKDLLCWFVFRVYRNITNASDDAPIRRPDDPVIKQIAERLLNDEKVIRSVKRYDGRDVIFFGEWTTPNGSIYEGGSKRTAAYKAAALALGEMGCVPRHTKVRKSGPQQPVTAERVPPSQGCAVLIAIALAIPFAAFAAYWA